MLRLAALDLYVVRNYRSLLGAGGKGTAAVMIAFLALTALPSATADTGRRSQNNNSKTEIEVEEMSNHRRISPDSFIARLQSVTGAEIFALSGTAQLLPAGPGRFPVRPYGQSSRIVATKEIAGDDAAALAALWRELKPGDTGYACHLPLYGLRFYSGSTNGARQMVFETTISFHCANFAVPAGDDSESDTWFTFDEKADAAHKLRAKLIELLPHPNLEEIENVTSGSF